MESIPLGVVALFLLVLVKELGVPLPPPTAIVVIGSGLLAVRGDFQPIPALGAIVVASILGSTGQFLLIRHGVKGWILRYLRYIGIEQRYIDRAVEFMRRRGGLAVGLGRMIPGPRGIVVPAAGLAHVPLVPFVMGYIIGNTLYVSAQFWLGMVGGQWAIDNLPLDAPSITIAGLVLSVVIYG
ncbi:MAG: VTT domain-containing protein, partial [Chloroflexi bacterium]|nr:VTT domain-containing protein [Chloroflexota bacterium]